MVKGENRKIKAGSNNGGQGNGLISSNVFKKGLWTTEEDMILMEYVKVHGKGKWNRIPHLTGLKRCGKSCRLRWMNYLSPNIKRGDFSQEEDDLIIRLHNLLGNRWSLIAGRVPGRTDNQVKNYWNTHLSKKHGAKKTWSKIVESSSSQRSTNKSVDSNVVARHQSGGGAVEKFKCVEDDIAKPSMEISNGEEILSTEKQNYQHSSPYSIEDDNLILNPQSLLEFLNEYSLDFTWNNIL